MRAVALLNRNLLVFGLLSQGVMRWPVRLKFHLYHSAGGQRLRL